MKTLIINLQTTLFLTNGNSILGAYNKHTNTLVYNKPNVMRTDYLERMLEQVDTIKARVKITGTTKTFQTDSFGINFYDHTTGGTSEFHQIK